MARLRTHNRRRYARQLGTEAATWRCRVQRDGRFFRELIRQTEAIYPPLAVKFRDLYRRGYPWSLMRKDLAQTFNLPEHEGEGA